ncbi:MAG: N-acetylneuraminate synthase family protein [Actinobacteria bacterium]|nr:N-acetylneuraminate synthase family protein [Actinomycetota bacterium]
MLETRFETASGAVTVIDCMPPRDGLPDVVRVVRGEAGRVDMRTELVIRFDYGSTVPWVRRIDERTCAVGGPDGLCVATPVELRGEDLRTVAEFTVAEGEEIPFVLSWYPSHEPPPRPIDALAAVAAGARVLEKHVTLRHDFSAFRDHQLSAEPAELAELVRRAQQAEGANANSAAAIKAAEDKVSEAEGRSEAIRKELADKLEAAQKELASKLDATQKDLSTKLETAQRELAAERKSSLALVDRKTQLERELADARAEGRRVVDEGAVVDRLEVVRGVEEDDELAVRPAILAPDDRQRAVHPLFDRVVHVRSVVVVGPHPLGLADRPQPVGPGLAWLDLAVGP